MSSVTWDSHNFDTHYHRHRIMTGVPQQNVNADRLFFGSCVALIATSVAFATVGAVMLALKREFVLTNEEGGWIGGAALWGFAVAQLAFAPLADSDGM